MKQKQGQPIERSHAFAPPERVEGFRTALSPKNTSNCVASFRPQAALRRDSSVLPTLKTTRMAINCTNRSQLSLAQQALCSRMRLTGPSANSRNPEVDPGVLPYA